MEITINVLLGIIYTLTAIAVPLGIYMSIRLFLIKRKMKRESKLKSQYGAHTTYSSSYSSGSVYMGTTEKKGSYESWEKAHANELERADKFWNETNISNIRQEVSRLNEEEFQYKPPVEYTSKSIGNS